MSGISLDQLNTEANERYGPFVIEDVPGGDVQLRHALRLAKSERARLQELQGRVKKMQSAKSTTTADGAVDAMADTIRLLAVGDGGERLLTALDGDAAKLALILELYGKATQLGEASRSAT